MYVHSSIPAGYPPRVRVQKNWPVKKPVPAPWVRVFAGTGTGTTKNTRGLPVQYTSGIGSIGLEEIGNDSVQCKFASASKDFLITYFGSGYFSRRHLIKHCIPPLLWATSGPISGPIVAHYLFPFMIIWFCILPISSEQNLYRNLNTVWFPVQFQNQITSSQRILNIFQLILMDDSLNMRFLLSE